MRWSITKPGTGPGTLKQEQSSFDDAVRRNVVLSRVQDLVSWGRKNSIWPSTSAFPAAMWKWPPASRASMTWLVSVPK